MPFDPPPASNPPDAVAAPAPPPSPPAALSQPAANFEMKTRQFVADLIEREAGQELEHYPEQVLYYGKSPAMPCWTTIENSTRAGRSGTTSWITIQGRWWVTNGQRSGSGTMTGTYRIFWWHNRYPRILVEASVAARDPTPASEPGRRVTLICAARPDSFRALACYFRARASLRKTFTSACAIFAAASL
jgi:hypothetical protein